MKILKQENRTIEYYAEDEVRNVKERYKQLTEQNILFVLVYSPENKLKRFKFLFKSA
uniref:Uncharacterized protein n=1 Tax=Dulem virus 36 TaxID=3145754 RepID=A0AAU8AYH8_9CAUD